MTLPLAKQRVLELGAGTGTLSLLSYRKGALVTATDINEEAIRNIRFNAEANDATIEVIHSDLFDALGNRSFDWIIVNPPYYPRAPKTPEEYAWNCGEDHQYFRKFFSGVKIYLRNASKVIMVLSDVCDMATITSIAADHHVRLTCIRERWVLIDGKNYIFEVEATDPTV